MTTKENSGATAATDELVLLVAEACGYEGSEEFSGDDDCADCGDCGDCSG